MVSIFIRTYQKDIKWLNYCLHFIHKNLTGFDEIVIVIPTGQEHLLAHLTYEKVHVCKSYRDDYLGQQISKLKAHEYCSGDFILFVDSDYMFFNPVDCSEFFIDNKPVILKDRYENVGEAICWKRVTEKLFREPIEWEYMRRAPQLYAKSSLEKFNELFPKIEQYIIEQPKSQFSEFNALGFFINKHEPENYHFHDLTIEPAPENKGHQFWSYSQLTEEEKILIDSHL